MSESSLQIIEYSQAAWRAALVERKPVAEPSEASRRPRVGLVEASLLPPRVMLAERCAVSAVDAALTHRSHRTRGAEHASSARAVVDAGVTAARLRLRALAADRARASARRARRLARVRPSGAAGVVEDSRRLVPLRGVVGRRAHRVERLVFHGLRVRLSVLMRELRYGACPRT